MAKVQKKVTTAVVKDAEGTVIAEISNEPRYRMVPVDQVTHRQLMELCELRGFGQRGQGALVRILIKKEYEAARLKK